MLAPLQRRIADEIALSRVRVIEALTDACVEASKDEPEADVIVGHVLDVLRSLDRQEALADAVTFAKEVSPS